MSWSVIDKGNKVFHENLSYEDAIEIVDSREPFELRCENQNRVSQHAVKIKVGKHRITGLKIFRGFITELEVINTEGEVARMLLADAPEKIRKEALKYL